MFCTRTAPFWISLYYASVAFLWSLYNPQQRLGVGEWIPCCNNPWVPITNAILIMISVTSALSAPWLSLFPAEGNMEDKEMTGPQVMWKFPLSPPQHLSPQLLLWGWGLFASQRGSFLSHNAQPPRLLYFLCTSLVGLAPFFPVKCVLGTLGFAPITHDSA